MHRYVTLIAILFSFTANAQECGFDAKNEQLMKLDPVYRMKVEQNKINWARFAKMKKNERLIINGMDTVFEIPIVFHVMHTGGAIGTFDNPSDAQLQACIDFTNACYQATWASFPHPGNGGTYIPFKFVLAKRDPDCMPTTGIVRVDASSLPDYTTNGIGTGGVPDATLKALSVWPNDQYYNVWTVNYIDGPTGGTAGYAYYPGAGPAIDGTVILSTYAASGSSTLAHEIGHAMGLAHTFEGDMGGTTCPVNVDCDVDGDGICDTEPHIQSIDCVTTINPCTGTSMNFTQHSFMSYSHGCRDRFTPGQGVKALYNLRNNRPSLMNSLGAVAPPPSAVAALCTPTVINTASTLDAGPRNFHFNTINQSSGGYTSSGNKVFVDYFCTQRTEVFTGMSYPVSITTGPQIENVRVYIDYDGDGLFLPTELAFGSNGNTANQVHTGNIIIPTTAVTTCTPLRMRVVSDVATAPAPTACSALSDGQAEDYVVTIKEPTGAALTIIPTSNFPTCRDTAITFTASSVSVPAGSPLVWLVNGAYAATGVTFTTSALQAGDKVVCYTSVTNTFCGTPDSIVSNEITITHLGGPAAPIISLIGNMLVANLSPVQWYLNGVLIPGATTQSYHPLTDGDYTAVTAALPCPSDPSNVLKVSLLSVGEYDLKQMKLFPNPADKNLNLDWGTIPTTATLDLFDAMAKLVSHTEVEKKTKAVINTSGLVPGVYFLRIMDDKGKTAATPIQVGH